MEWKKCRKISCGSVSIIIYSITIACVRDNLVRDHFIPSTRVDCTMQNVHKWNEISIHLAHFIKNINGNVCALARQYDINYDGRALEYWGIWHSAESTRCQLKETSRVYYTFRTWAEPQCRITCDTRTRKKIFSNNIINENFDDDKNANGVKILAARQLNKMLS